MKPRQSRYDCSITEGLDKPLAITRQEKGWRTLPLVRRPLWPSPLAVLGVHRTYRGGVKRVAKFDAQEREAADREASRQLNPQV